MNILLIYPLFLFYLYIYIYIYIYMYYNNFNDLHLKAYFPQDLVSFP